MLLGADYCGGFPRNHLLTTQCRYISFPLKCLFNLFPRKDQSDFHKLFIYLLLHVLFGRDLQHKLQVTFVVHLFVLIVLFAFHMLQSTENMDASEAVQQSTAAEQSMGSMSLQL